ncbi:50S ribosomal protein L9 [Candidatus Bathyarchaeota archaeon]|nr:MAG: 50S ribosomal protein L9 [Candidatus Bathyarchaeota archaeon]
MKVVFLEDVPNVARSGEIKEVADGYARNLLIPKKLALIANSAAIKLAEARCRAKTRQQAETEAELQELAKQIDGKEITLKARAGSTDRLYGSITSADIAAELEKSAGVVVDKRKIDLEEHIHQLGSYEVTVRLGRDITPKVKVNVIEEKVEDEAEAKAEKKTRKKAKEKTEEKVEDEAEAKAEKKTEEETEEKTEEKVED